MGVYDPHARPPVVLSRTGTQEVWQFAARIVRWTDGDTAVVDCLVDVGFQRMATERRTIRLLGVNTPETRGTTGEVRARALEAKAFVTERWPGANSGELLRDPRGCPVVVTVEGFDKFGGRDDGRIVDLRGQDVSQALIDAGLGDPYDGGAR